MKSGNCASHSSLSLDNTTLSFLGVKVYWVGFFVICRMGFIFFLLVVLVHINAVHHEVTKSAVFEAFCCSSFRLQSPVLYNGIVVHVGQGRGVCAALRNSLVYVQCSAAVRERRDRGSCVLNIPRQGFHPGQCSLTQYQHGDRFLFQLKGRLGSFGNDAAAIPLEDVGGGGVVASGDHAAMDHVTGSIASGLAGHGGLLEDYVM